MACFKHGTVIDLAARENLPLPDMRGTTLRVARGTVWITQENDTQDIVLRAGDTWTVERNGLTLVQAQADATFCVLGRNLEKWAAPATTRRFASTKVWRQVQGAFAAIFAVRMRNPYPHV